MRWLFLLILLIGFAYAKPEIVVKKHISDDSIKVNGSTQVTVRISNEGDDTALDINVNDPIPDDFELNGERAWPDKLEAGKTVEIVYFLKALAEGSYHVSPTSIKYEDSRGNEYTSVSEPSDIRVWSRDTVFTIMKKVDKKEVPKGEKLTVIIELENLGNRRIENINVEDTVPEEFEILETDLGAIKINFIGRKGTARADFDPLNYKEIRYTLMAKSEGSITLEPAVVRYEYAGETIEEESNKVTVTVGPYKPPEEEKPEEKPEKNITKPIKKEANIIVMKQVEKNIIEKGNSVRVTIKIRNDGTGEAKGLRVLDTVPEGFSLISGSTTKTYSSLMPGSEVEFSYLVECDKPMNYTLPTAQVVFNDELGTHSVKSNELEISVIETGIKLPEIPWKRIGIGVVVVALALGIVLGITRMSTQKRPKYGYRKTRRPPGLGRR